MEELPDDFIDGLLAEPEKYRSKVLPVNVDKSELIWCEFCKGYYIEEYHFGRSVDGEDSTDGE